MKKYFLLSILICSLGSLHAQETLQSVTTRGAVTSNTITIGNLNSIPAGVPSGSSIKLTSPGGDIGIVIVKGDGAGGTTQRWDTYINTKQSYILSDRTAAGAAKDRFCIDTLGNIGINTITPKEKLSVRGNIRAIEVKVESSNWPDYVFMDDYKLPTLQQTAKYIKANGHLQDMPTAREVANQGIALGELNAKLLRKIEELTLHLINLEEDNKKQQIEIDALKARK